MADVKWIKIVTDIFDDEKILLIESMPEADGIIVCWFKLLCLAGKQNNGGCFMMNDRIAYTDEMLSTIFRRPLNTVRLAMNTFEQFGMVEIINGVITIPNWEKHQNIDGLDKIREQNRLRKAKYDQKRKELPSGNVTSNVTSNVTVTCGNATDKNRKEEEKNKIEILPLGNISGKKKPPTLEEVIAYAQSRNGTVDPVKFFEYFEAGEWKDAKGNKVASWKQKFLTWEKYDTEKKPSDMTQRHKYSQEEQNDALRDLAALQKIYSEKEKQ